MSVRGFFALFVLLLCTGVADAAVFRNVHYAGSADSQDVLQALDVYVPDSPGPHPVVFHLHGGAWQRGDKSDVGYKASSFIGRGFVFVSANYRLAPDAPHPAAIEDAAAALAWFYRHASSYAGDANRIVLLGDEAGAHLAALLATDARWLRTHNLTPAIVRGVVALDGYAFDFAAVPAEVREALAAAFGESTAVRRLASPVTHVDRSAPLPPFLLMHARGDTAVRRQAERLADRVRGAGAAVVVLPHDGAAGRLGTELGAATDTATEQMYAWLAALDVPRVQRLENVAFGQPAAVPTGTGAIADLVAHDGRIYSRLDGDARVLVQHAMDAPWTVDTDFGARIVLLDRSVDGTLFAGLDGEDGAAVALRAGDGSWRRVPLGARGAALHGAGHRDRVTAANALFVGTDRIWRVSPEPDVDAVAEPGIDGPVLALVEAVGTLYASVGGADGAGLYARSDGESPRWTLVRPYVEESRQLRALTEVPDPLGRGHRVLLATDLGGRVVRVDPVTGYDMTDEIDLDTAFASLWGGAPDAVRIASARFVPVQHPENGELVWVAGLAARHPEAPAAPFDGAYYLVRQHDASYAYGVARDAGGATRFGPAVRAIASVPFVDSAGRALVFGGGTATEPALLAARFHRSAPRRGFWWDRARSGHGLALFPLGARWAAVLYTYDADGEPTWYFAQGDLRENVFVADARGLARYTYDDSRTPAQQVDAATSGTLALRFDVAPDAGACATAERAGARALATLDVVLGGASSTFCLEPFVFGAPGLPEVDANGLWSGGDADAGWGLAIATQGATGETRETAVLLYHDDAGAPRWALGAGVAVRGAAELELVVFRGACPACVPRTPEPQFAGVLSHDLFGPCGEVRGTIWFRVESGAQSLRRNEARLQPLSSPGCY